MRGLIPIRQKKAVKMMWRESNITRREPKSNYTKYREEGQIEEDHTDVHRLATRLFCFGPFEQTTNDFFSFIFYSFQQMVRRRSAEKISVPTPKSYIYAGDYEKNFSKSLQGNISLCKSLVRCRLESAGCVRCPRTSGHVRRGGGNWNLFQSVVCSSFGMS